jgi:hypothetical protein
MTDPMDPNDPDLNPVEYEQGTRYHLDIDTGDVYQFNDDNDWVLIGQIPGTGGGDGTAPSKVTGLVLTPQTQILPDGTMLSSIVATWDPVPETDVIGYEVQFDTEDTFATVATRNTNGLQTMLESAVPGITYWGRVRAYDREGLSGPWSDVATCITLDDGQAPGIPSDVVVIPGYKMIGVYWTVGSETDLSHHEVQYTRDDDTGVEVPPDPKPPGAPVVAEARTIEAAGGSAIISGLETGVIYWARVRALDRAGYVKVPGDPNAEPPIPDSAVLAAADPEAGWSEWESGKATLLVGSSDLAVHALAAEFVTTGILDANRITTGVLSVGKPAQASSGIEVFDQYSRFIGSWKADGQVMVNPDNLNTLGLPKEAMWLHAGALKFTTNLIWDSATPKRPDLDLTEWATAITPYGINAEAITFGTSTAGHNLVPNAGMEHQPFTTVAELNDLWDLTAQWGEGTGRINLDVSTGDLRLAAV